LLILAGSVLLFSGATPTATGVAAVLRDVMPLPMMETSHLLGSLVGWLLLFFARALWLRLEVEYPAAVALLLFGILFSLLKGFDWQEALILSVMLVLFLPIRRYFYRDSALLEMPFTLPWYGLIGLLLGTSVWLGFFSYQHVGYADTLWWEFTHAGDVSRFLRASVILGGCVIAFGPYRLLRVAVPLYSTALDEDREALLAVARAASQSSGDLASAGGDKSILWSHLRRAFLMYRTNRKYWVTMADPLGDVADHDELVWRFRELADHHGAMPVFYQVSCHHLPLYLDMGLILFKPCEEARVPLATLICRATDAAASAIRSSAWACLA